MPTEIFLRKSGKSNMGKEECLVFVSDGILRINPGVARKFGIRVLIGK